MWFLSSGRQSEPIIEIDGLSLRIPGQDDYKAWRAVRESSRAFLQPWEPTWPRDDLTQKAFRRRIRRYQHRRREDRVHAFFLFRNADNQLMGGLTLSNIRRGVIQAGTLGYWMGEAYAGKGHMRRAVRALLPYAYETLHLHRIEAACVPTNTSSRMLLEKAGFQREGFAEKYLFINGQWLDHLLFAHRADFLAEKPRLSANFADILRQSSL